MDLLPPLPPTFITFALAAGSVVAGAPLFAAGRRALRLRQALASLREAPLDADASGVVAVRGRVALEGPMFAPLSGRPCAGFTLEVAGDRMSVGAVLHELRPFRLQGESASARVVAEHAHLTTAVTSERTLAPGEALPQRLGELLAGSAEVRWLLDRRVPIRLVERALEVGAEIVVTGIARPAEAVRPVIATVASVETVELAATGTDGAGWGIATASHTRNAGTTSAPALWIEAGEPFEQLELSSSAPDAATLAPPVWRIALVLVGPLLTIAGLLALAQLAAPLIGGRF